MSGERQVPFYCPYCGEENLRPAGADAGEWECRACARGFSLKFVGVVRPATLDSATPGSASPGSASPGRATLDRALRSAS